MGSLRNKTTVRSVSSDIYTRDYYLHQVGGYEFFGKSELFQKYDYALKLAGVGMGDKVLDVGCGRGEVVLQAACRGCEAVGVDYSIDAIRVAIDGKIEVPGIGIDNQSKFLVGNSKMLPFADGTFDVIFFLDVVEHLYPEEVALVLREMARVLKPGGKVVIHTCPNRLYTQYVVPLYTRWIRLLLYWPVKLLLGRQLKLVRRTKEEELMHVNEQTPMALRKSLTDAGFSCQVWTKLLPGSQPFQDVYELVAAMVSNLWPLGVVYPLSLVLKKHIFAVGQKN